MPFEPAGGLQSKARQIRCRGTSSIVKSQGVDAVAQFINLLHCVALQHCICFFEDGGLAFLKVALQS